MLSITDDSIVSERAHQGQGWCQAEHPTVKTLLQLQIQKQQWLSCKNSICFEQIEPTQPRLIFITVWENFIHEKSESRTHQTTGIKRKKKKNVINLAFICDR